jgi:hypothetical protein
MDNDEYGLSSLFKVFDMYCKDALNQVGIYARDRVD